MSAQDECPFCRVAAGHDPDAREVWRSDDVVAFFPTNPAVPGHTLVVPREHFATLWDLNDESAASLGIAVRRLAKLMKGALGLTALSLIQSNGVEATQTVAHVHFHLVPRREGDEMGPIWPQAPKHSESDEDNVWRALRRACETTMR